MFSRIFKEFIFSKVVHNLCFHFTKVLNLIYFNINVSSNNHSCSTNGETIQVKNLLNVKERKTQQAVEAVELVLYNVGRPVADMEYCASIARGRFVSVCGSICGLN